LHLHHPANGLPCSCCSWHPGSWCGTHTPALPWQYTSSQKPLTSPHQPWVTLLLAVLLLLLLLLLLLPTLLHGMLLGPTVITRPASERLSGYCCAVLSKCMLVSRGKTSSCNLSWWCCCCCFLCSHQPPALEVAHLLLPQ
jgi:hypothetical protein